MSYNCISSPSVCCLASILVGNREGVAIHMNSNLMTLSVCNLSTPPNCNCNADDQGLGTDNVTLWVFLTELLTLLAASQTKGETGPVITTHRNKRYYQIKCSLIIRDL